MAKKIIMRSDALPQHLQAELATMETALVKRYGTAAHMVGTMMENLAQVCGMVRSELSPEERMAAFERSREACGEVLRVLGHVLNVEHSHAIAVAQAYQDIGKRIEEELFGADTALASVEGEAAAVIAKARTLH
jgi:hypothetical protein